MRVFKLIRNFQPNDNIYLYHPTKNSINFREDLKLAYHQYGEQLPNLQYGHIDKVEFISFVRSYLHSECGYTEFEFEDKISFNNKIPSHTTGTSHTSYGTRTMNMGEADIDDWIHDKMDTINEFNNNMFIKSTEVRYKIQNIIRNSGVSNPWRYSVFVGCRYSVNKNFVMYVFIDKIENLEVHTHNKIRNAVIRMGYIPFLYNCNNLGTVKESFKIWAN